MNVPLINTLFVKFADDVEEIKMQTGFRKGVSYPVFAVDVIDLDDNERETSFLLADVKGIFVWVKTSFLRRLPPQYAGVITSPAKPSCSAGRPVAQSARH